MGGGGGVRKINILFFLFIYFFFFWGGGYEDFGDFLGGNHKIGLYLGVISKHLWSFLAVKVKKGGCFLGLVKFQIFFGVLEIPDIFWGER